MIGFEGDLHLAELPGDILRRSLQSSARQLGQHLLPGRIQWKRAVCKYKALFYKDIQGTFEVIGRGRLSIAICLFTVVL